MEQNCPNALSPIESKSLILSTVFFIFFLETDFFEIGSEPNWADSGIWLGYIQSLIFASCGGIYTLIGGWGEGSGSLNMSYDRLNSQLFILREVISRIVINTRHTSAD